jgi:hypothetical protein
VPSPCVTVRDAGVAEIEKSGTGAPWITSDAVVLCTTDPAVPVMVSVYVPGAADPVVERSNVEVAPPDVGVTEGGVNEGVTPAGAPLTESPTEELKPASEVSVTV